MVITMLLRDSVWNNIKNITWCRAAATAAAAAGFIFALSISLPKLEISDNWYLILICGIIYQLTS